MHKIAIPMTATGIVLAGLALSSDDSPLSRVSVTEVLRHEVSQRIELPGTVEAPKSSRVASEVEGLVVEMRAREGRHVRKGDPLVVLRTDALELELERATGDAREAEARLALAQGQLDRSRQLFEQQVLSRQQLDDARFEYQAWRGRADRLEAEIARIRLDVDRSTVKAPFDGVVVLEATEVGEWVGKGETIMELLSPYTLDVRVDLPERYYEQVRTVAKARVRFEALAGYEVEGRIESLVPRANAQSRTFPLRVRVKNDKGRIGAGMLAKVSLSSGESEGAQLVPKDAIVTRGNDRFLFVVNDESVVEVIPVTTGLAIGDWIAVEGRVAADSKVVTRGNERIRPGQKVAAELLSYPAP